MQSSSVISILVSNRNLFINQYSSSFDFCRYILERFQLKVIYIWATEEIFLDWVFFSCCITFLTFFSYRVDSKDLCAFKGHDAFNRSVIEEFERYANKVSANHRECVRSFQLYIFCTVYFHRWRAILSWEDLDIFFFFFFAKIWKFWRGG